MRLHQNPVFVRRAPPATVAAAVFREIDWTVHLVRPTIGGNSPLALVDPHQRTGMQHRVHRPVLQADKAVPVPPHIPAIEQAESRFSPAPDDMTEKSGGI